MRLLALFIVQFMCYLLFFRIYHSNKYAWIPTKQFTHICICLWLGFCFCIWKKNYLGFGFGNLFTNNSKWWEEKKLSAMIMILGIATHHNNVKQSLQRPYSTNIPIDNIHVLRKFSQLKPHQPACLDMAAMGTLICTQNRISTTNRYAFGRVCV